MCTHWSEIPTAPRGTPRMDRLESRPRYASPELCCDSDGNGFAFAVFFHSRCCSWLVPSTANCSLRCAIVHSSGCQQAASCRAYPLLAVVTNTVGAHGDSIGRSSCVLGSWRVGLAGRFVDAAATLGSLHSSFTARCGSVQLFFGFASLPYSQRPSSTDRHEEGRPWLLQKSAAAGCSRIGSSSRYSCGNSKRTGVVIGRIN